MRVDPRPPLVTRVKGWAAALRRDVAALRLAARDPRTPVLAKIVAGATAAYALSPIDLVPDFIPLLGQLDDLLIVPAGLWLAVRLVPPALMAEFRIAAAGDARTISRAAAVAVIAAWVAAAAALGAIMLRDR